MSIVYNPSSVVITFQNGDRVEQLKSIDYVAPSVVHQLSLVRGLSYCGVKYSDENEPPGAAQVTCPACLKKLFRNTRHDSKPQHGEIPMRPRKR